MIAAGVRKPACNFGQQRQTLRKQPDGTVLVTDGPYIETRSTWVVSGYWAADMD
jgi:hypothetical protein